jgi:GntR family transcriptional regulator/GntR family mannosyl-D-glycerate transport/metabolism transcriptional repressor
MVDDRSSVPLYSQLAEELAAAMESDVIQEGQLLPSESRLQREHGVCRGTVRAAIKLLRQRVWRTRSRRAVHSPAARHRINKDLTAHAAIHRSVATWKAAVVPVRAGRCGAEGSLPRAEFSPRLCTLTPRLRTRRD